MNNVKNLLPIGSVILLRDGEKRLMIYGIKQTDVDSGKEFDYIGVLYPEGNMGEGTQYLFNHDDIEKTYFNGFVDEERDEFIEKLNEYYENK